VLNVLSSHNVILESGGTGSGSDLVGSYRLQIEQVATALCTVPIIRRPADEYRLIKSLGMTPRVLFNTAHSLGVCKANSAPSGAGEGSETQE